MQVIPQLIARIDTPRTNVGRLIHQLLFDIGKQHPQALIYPLTVASKSSSPARHAAANKVLKNMCEHSNTLVQQAMLVGPRGEGRVEGLGFHVALRSSCSIKHKRGWTKRYSQPGLFLNKRNMEVGMGFSLSIFLFVS